MEILNFTQKYVSNENSACPACPMKCLPREMRSLFFWGKAYFIGVAPADGTGVREPLKMELITN